MGLARDRAEAHRTCAEALDDLARRLDLLERDRGRATISDLQQAAQGRFARCILVDRARVLAVLLEGGAVAHVLVCRLVALQGGCHVTVGRADGVLDQRDRLGVPHVVLAVAPPRVDTADRKQLVLRGRVGTGVALERLLGQDSLADPADARGRSREMSPDQLWVETHGLEDLRAPVGLDRRDPHLGDRLEESFADRLDDVLGRLLGTDALLAAIGAFAHDASFEDHLVERLEQQIGVDRAHAVADQRREVMDLARLPGLEDDPRPQARALEHEMVVHRGNREQRRDRGPAGPEQAVGEDDDVDPLRDRLPRLAADALDRAVHSGRTLGDRPGDVDRECLVDVMFDVAQRLELAIEQDRLVEKELVGMLGRLFEEVALVAEARSEAHHDFLADRVDRRVRDLSEQLLEVGEERRGLVGEHSEGDVVAHRPGRLGAVEGHRREQHPQVLLRVAEGTLAQAHGLV